MICAESEVGILQQIARGSGADKIENVFLLIVHRERHDADVRRLPLDGAGGLHPVHAGHAHVHQDDVGL